MYSNNVILMNKRKIGSFTSVMYNDSELLLGKTRLWMQVNLYYYIESFVYFE